MAATPRGCARFIRRRWKETRRRIKTARKQSTWKATNKQAVNIKKRDQHLLGRGTPGSPAVLFHDNLLAVPLFGGETSTHGGRTLTSSSAIGSNGLRVSRSTPSHPTSAATASATASASW